MSSIDINNLIDHPFEQQKEPIKRRDSINEGSNNNNRSSLAFSKRASESQAMNEETKENLAYNGKKTLKQITFNLALTPSPASSKDLKGQCSSNYAEDSSDGVAAEIKEEVGLSLPGG
jgi:hypothetical protein